MTNILELLKNEKVEWQKLKDILISINTGLNPRRNFVLNDRGRILTSWYITTKDYSQNEKIEFIEGKTAKITEEARKIINQRSKLEKGDLLFSAVGTVGKVALVEIEPDNFDVNESTFILKPNNSIVDSKYLMYYLRGNTFQNILSSNLKGSTLSGIRKGDLECFEIPIPSPETQEKIVEILDKLTNYVTELQSELQLRTKQYTYYRDKLLSEDYLNKITKEMEEDRRLSIVQLEEIVTIKNGKDWKTLGEGNIPVYGSGGEMGVFVNKYSYDKPTVLIPRKGSIDNVFYLDKPFWNVDTIFYTEIDDSKLIPKYFYYFIENYDLKKLSENSTRPSLTQSSLNKLKFPIPPLSLQNKIVKVLDKFQILLADTKGLLPEEIEQRQKQYEYYREKLLTFDVECDSTHARTHARTHIISNLYYEILQKAARIVEVDIEDKVEWKMLSGISKEKLSYGSGAKAVTYDGETRYIRITDIDDKGQLKQEKVSPSFAEGKYIVRKGDILFARSGATVGKNYIHLESKQAIYAGYLIKFSADVNKVISKYVYYCVNDSRYEKFVFNMKSNASQPNINAQQYSNFQILLPPLHVQQHVVNVLDKFDILVNDIKEGLPKEIEQRQKQYEYWREQLLSFNL